MAKLWPELIEPQELTEYARMQLSEVEKAKGNLANWLPNRLVNDTVVRWRQNDNGLVSLAAFRGWDNEPEIGPKRGGKRHKIEMEPIARSVPVSELDQIRARNTNDESLREMILGAVDDLVNAIADTAEAARGKVLVSAKFEAPEIGVEDDYNRRADHDITLASGKQWTDAKVSRLDLLQEWHDMYEETNGFTPGCILMSRRVFRLLSTGEEFKTNLIGGGSRPATQEQVNEIIESAGLAPIHVYTRRTSAGLVLPDNKLLLLPAPVESSNYLGTKLGATLWGQTLTAQDPAYSLADSEQPGLVVGVYRNETPPLITRTIADAAFQPVLFNPDMSLVATVA